MIGYAICGSFCNHNKALEVLKQFAANDEEILPILSENSYNISTRFGIAEDFRKAVEDITKNKIIHTIEDSEPIGPMYKLNALIIAPCSGNTLAKMAHGITDTSVTMAAKAHLRNQKPLIIGLCTNDGLSSNTANIGIMLNKKNVYFVPFYQDDIDLKPTSLVCDMKLVYKTYQLSLEQKQIQPIIF